MRWTCSRNSNDRCPDAAWGRVSESDGRSVAQIAYHCAMGNQVAMGWICKMLARRPVYESLETHDALNIEEAERASGLTKDEVIEELERTTRSFAAFVSTLTDAELDRSSIFGPAGQERSVGRFIANIGRHPRGHLETMKTTAGI
jgi:DinB family protein